MGYIGYTIGGIEIGSIMWIVFGTVTALVVSLWVWNRSRFISAIVFVLLMYGVIYSNEDLYIFITTFFRSLFG